MHEHTTEGESCNNSSFNLTIYFSFVFIELLSPSIHIKLIANTKYCQIGHFLVAPSRFLYTLFCSSDSFVLQLVGNKCDLERQVSLEEVSLFCSNKQLSYVETSSTDSEQTNQLFHRLGEEIIKKGYYKGVPGDRSPPSRSLSVSSSVPLTTPRASCCGLRRHPTNP